MRISRRRLTQAALATVMAPAWSAASAQEAFPSRPIKVLVTFAPGTGSDTVARIVTAAMGPLLGQAIVVDNRAGAGGVIGTDQGLKSPPDGYTLTLGTTSTLLTNPALNPNVRYNAERDFAPVGALARTAFMVVTANTPEAPKTLQELLALLKDKGGSFGSAGIGTITHLASELLLKRAAVKATHVPYKGSSASLTDVASGQLNFATDTAVAALPLVRAGKLRVLAVTSAERLPGLPAAPTMVESGFPGFKVTAWWGLMAPANTPPDVLKKLSDATLKALGTPEIKAQLAAQELEPYPLGGPAFAALIREELPVWTQFVQQLGLRVEF
jgi:tripartite-type tricarboxylate transporter receptor subunit TctC